MPCAIDGRPNGEFRVGENLIEGTFLELLPARCIIQTWKIAAYGWPADHFSTLRLELQPEGRGTVVTLEQRDVPRVCLPFIESGWYSYYWRPMAASSWPTSRDAASAP
jgi:activator of HSP90 ATPase